MDKNKEIETDDTQTSQDKSMQEAQEPAGDDKTQPAGQSPKPVRKKANATRVKKEPAGDDKKQTSGEDSDLTKETSREQTKVNKTAAQIVEHYTKLYPHNDEFHVTSDGQVFLKGDRSLALMHQRTLSGGGEVETIKIK